MTPLAAADGTTTNTSDRSPIRGETLGGMMNVAGIEKYNNVVLTNILQSVKIGKNLFLLNLTQFCYVENEINVAQYLYTSGTHLLQST